MEDDSVLSFHRRKHIPSSNAFDGQTTASSHRLHQTQPSHLSFHSIATAAAPQTSKTYQHQPVVQDRSFLRAEAEQYLAEILISRATDTVRNCNPTPACQNILRTSPPPYSATPETYPTGNKNNLESQTLSQSEDMNSIPVSSSPLQTSTTTTSAFDINTIRSDVDVKPDLMQDTVYSDVSSDGCLNEIFDINSSDEETNFEKGNHEIRLEDEEIKNELADDSNSSVTIVQQMVSVSTQTEQQHPEDLKIRSIVELDTAINYMRHEMFGIREQLDHISRQNAHQNAQDWQALDCQQKILEEIKLMGEQNKLGMEIINSNISALRKQIEELFNGTQQPAGYGVPISNLTEIQRTRPSLPEENIERRMNVVQMDNTMKSSTTKNAITTCGNKSTIGVTPMSKISPISNAMANSRTTSPMTSLGMTQGPVDICSSKPCLQLYLSMDRSST